MVKKLVTESNDLQKNTKGLKKAGVLDGLPHLIVQPNTPPKKHQEQKSSSSSDFDSLRAKQKQRIEASSKRTQATVRQTQNKSVARSAVQNTYNKVWYYFQDPDFAPTLRWITKADEEVENLQDAIAASVYVKEDYVAKSAAQLFANLSNYQKGSERITDIIQLQQEVGESKDLQSKANTVINKSVNLVTKVLPGVGKVVKEGAKAAKSAAKYMFDGDHAVKTNQKVLTWFQQKTQTSVDIAQVIYATKAKKAELGFFRYFHSPLATYRNHTAQVLALSLREYQHDKRISRNQTNQGWIETIVKFRSYAELLHKTKISEPDIMMTGETKKAYEALEVWQTRLNERGDAKLPKSSIRDINTHIDRLMDSLTRDFHKHIDADKGQAPSILLR